MNLKNLNIILSCFAIVTLLLDFLKYDEFRLERGYLDILILLLFLNIVINLLKHELSILKTITNIVLIGFGFFNLYVFGMLSFAIGFTGGSFPLIVIISIVLNIVLMFILFRNTLKIVIQ